ncbi:glycosyltransferase family 2 protein [Desulfosporosinus hippei]|uniref:Glycosyltransferase involved in cell wall bisynthesis n=1 Tax=Desulfosporosinus hippei DSM 8344 TaxID=1121419 RepID=A0A1G8EVR5_9FIRM|nr:glycosyltransferase [Desulfosporosinus hippei]SDH73809.1 Glycosyltransferase involved in cell wall bisynthesis [Desulfosporosinus hippei DSM 8344]
MENSEVKVSVIIPIYNVGKFLGKCIETIINQTYYNIEIILVDDGSPDHSGRICDEYAAKDKRIKVIHQKNAGVSSARNAGINAASGDYICFVDGDDYLMPDYVEYLLDLAVRNDADVSLTTEMFSNYNLNQIKKDKMEVYSAEKAAAEILCYNIPVGANNKMFKRSFIGDKIRFLPNLIIGEGFNFNTAAFQRANIVGVGHRRIYYYRKDNPTSVTTKFSMDNWINGLMAIEVIKNDFIIKTSKLNNAWKYANWRTHSDVYDLMVLASVEKRYPEMYKKCLHVTRTQALFSLRVPTSAKERIRAMIMMVCPRMMPQLMLLRRYLYHVDVEN